MAPRKQEFQEKKSFHQVIVQWHTHGLNKKTGVVSFEEALILFSCAPISHLDTCCSGTISLSNLFSISTVINQVQQELGCSTV